MGDMGEMYERWDLGAERWGLSCERHKGFGF